MEDFNPQLQVYNVIYTYLCEYRRYLDLQCTCSCCTLGLWGWRCAASEAAVSGSQQWAEVDRYDRHRCRYGSPGLEYHEPLTPGHTHREMTRVHDFNQSINGWIKESINQYINQSNQSIKVPCLEAGLEVFNHIIIHSNFHLNIFRGFRSTGAQSFGFPTDFAGHRYNSAAVLYSLWF